MRKFCLILVLVSLLNVLSSIGNALNVQKSQRSLKGSDLRQSQATRLKLLQQELPKLTGSALALKNPELKIETLAQLADLLWDHDSEGARDLFEKTYELLRSIEPADDRAQP